MRAGLEVQISDVNPQELTGSLLVNRGAGPRVDTPAQTKGHTSRKLKSAVVPYLNILNIELPGQSDVNRVTPPIHPHGSLECKVGSRTVLIDAYWSSTGLEVEWKT